MMKKTFLTTATCIMALFVTSCNNGSSNNDDANVKIDTLSYIAGMEIGNVVNSNIVPFYKIDYNTFKSSLSNILEKDSIVVEGVNISKNTMKEVSQTYMNDELGSRIMAAYADTTGTANVYKDEAEKKIVTTILAANIAFNAEFLPFKLENASLIRAIDDVRNNKTRMTNEAAMTYFTNYISEENKKASLEWLAEVEKQEGVMKTESGLLYKIEKAGNIRVKATKDEDVVKAVYTGRTKDGQIFDSNRWSDLPVQRQEMLKRQNPKNEGKDTPIEFPLNGVIKGWTEGMKLIGKGGKITLWIPAELAYGERGAGRDIGPNEALRFDIELVDVIKK